MAIDIENPGGDAAALKEAILDIILPDITADDGPAEGDGQAINLTSGNGGATSGAGGALNLTAGDGGSTSGDGGDVTIRSGAAPVVGDGGGLSLTAGTSIDGDGGGAGLYAGDGTNGGGSVDLHAGSGGVSGGGHVLISAGNAVSDNGPGGNITLLPGTGEGSGVKGHVIIEGLEDFADDAAAATGNVPVNGFYRNGSVFMVRVA